MGGSDAPGNAISIPAVMISKADGQILKTQLSGGATIVGSLKRDTPPAKKRDGDLDNGVMCHEYGHGISNRLTGGGTCFRWVAMKKEAKDGAILLRFI
jgi:hypothetical protein